MPNTEKKETSISNIIKSRILADKSSFFANDSIHEYVREGELELLQKEVENNIKRVLESLVIDIENDHNTMETAKRIAKKYITEIFKGRYTNPPKITKFPNYRKLDSIYTVGPITVRSTCSHHFAAITGSTWVGIVPDKNVIGLSKIARIVDWIGSRPQIQEELTVQLAEYIEKIISPKGLIVFCEALHMCMTWRGVKDFNTTMNTVFAKGCMEKLEMQDQFLKLIDKTRN